MQEVNQLVLGIDLCDDITQVTVMRPYSAEPEAVSFDAETRREFIPTVLVKTGDAWKLQENQEISGELVSGFFHNAMCQVQETEKENARSGRELVKKYISLLLNRIQDRFMEQGIGFLSVTCEEAEEEQCVTFLTELLLELGFVKGQFEVFSHLTAFLHYAVRQEESLWKNGASVFDYTSSGLRFYSMECFTRGGERLLISDQRDYSDVMPKDYLATETTERAALTFERLAGKVLQGQGNVLYITGRGFEGEWTADVLRMLSVGRRVFRGQNLYTQGACYRASEVYYQNQSTPFAVLLPDRITYDVYLQAETADEQETHLVAAGTAFRDVYAEAVVLLDTVDKLAFRVVKVGTDREYLIRVAPRDLRIRADRTSRYEVRIFFVKKTQMVIQVKDLGFGEFYPSTSRLFEEIIDLSQLEQ